MLYCLVSAYRGRLVLSAVLGLFSQFAKLGSVAFGLMLVLAQFSESLAPPLLQAVPAHLVPLVIVAISVVYAAAASADYLARRVLLTLDRRHNPDPRKASVGLFYVVNGSITNGAAALGLVLLALAMAVIPTLLIVAATTAIYLSVRAYTLMQERESGERVRWMHEGIGRLLLAGDGTLAAAMAIIVLFAVNDGFPGDFGTVAIVYLVAVRYMLSAVQGTAVNLHRLVFLTSNSRVLIEEA